MSYSDIIVMLARQRSGTNALRSILESHPDIYCFNEVFNFADKDSEHSSLRDSNFFTFVEEYAKGDVRRLFPDKHEKLFIDFLEYLRCFSSERYLVIDIKYNMTHFFTKPWQSMMSRYLLDLIAEHRLRVLHITRKNYLRYVLSVLKAFRSGSYAATPQDSIEDRTTHVSVDFMLAEFDKCRVEDEFIEKQFDCYPYLMSYEYANLFPSNSGEIASGFLDAVSDWLDIPNSFDRASPEFRKQSYLRLAETIENFEEVTVALSGTSYEHFLEDEPGYSRPKELARRG